MGSGLWGGISIIGSGAGVEVGVGVGVGVGTGGIMGSDSGAGVRICDTSDVSESVGVSRDVGVSGVSVVSNVFGVSRDVGVSGVSGTSGIVFEAACKSAAYLSSIS